MNHLFLRIKHQKTQQKHVKVRNKRLCVWVCVCQSGGGGQQSVKSHLSVLLLRWQRLLKWSNVASAGESETLPHTDRKHKHTDFACTPSSPVHRKTHKHPHRFKYVFMHLRTQGETHSHVKWKDCAQPQTRTNNYMPVCIHTQTRKQPEMPEHTQQHIRLDKDTSSL